MARSGYYSVSREAASYGFHMGADAAKSSILMVTKNIMGDSLAYMQGVSGGLTQRSLFNSFAGIYSWR